MDRIIRESVKREMVKKRRIKEQREEESLKRLMERDRRESMNKSVRESNLKK
jgi:hypothetical protein